MTLLAGIYALLVLAFPIAALWIGVTWLVGWIKEKR